MPECATCLPASVHDAPGIGFDLTTSYGTSAARLHNGSTINLAVVQASSEYRNLMVRLANMRKPPETTIQENFRRWLNKKVGWPATPDVSIIADLIRQLHRESAKVLQASERIVVTAPLLPAVTQEDINDAIEYAGLQSWLTLPFPYPRRLSEARAAFGANGNGLCQTYKYLYQCEDEYEDMPFETVYFVSFSQYALYTTIGAYTSAFALDFSSERYLADFESGLDNQPPNDTAAYSEYWSHISNQLLDLPKQGNRPVTKLILGGENATHPKFLSVLTEAMNTLSGPFSQVTTTDNGYGDMTVEEPLFAAARGAALYVRWRQEAPFDCVERDECELERARMKEAVVTAAPGKAELR